MKVSLIFKNATLSDKQKINFWSLKGVYLMSLTVNLYYTGVNGTARKFAEEMTQSGIVNRIQAEEGNLKYNYFVPLADPETILLIDSWENQAALDQHHTSPMMAELAALRDKYDLHMQVERYRSDDSTDSQDSQFIRR